MSKRKHYSPEYKRELVDLVRRSQWTCPQIALEVGVNPNILTRWVREADAGGGKAIRGGGVRRDEEMARLKREFSKVTSEPEFLKDAAVLSTVPLDVDRRIALVHGQSQSQGVRLCPVS